MPSLLCRRVGRRLQTLRRMRGWSQAYLAERIGWEPETVSRYERGHRSFSLEALERFAHALDVPLSELVRIVLDSEDTSHERRVLRSLLATLPDTHVRIVRRLAELHLADLAIAHTESHNPATPEENSL